ncbi:MAG: GNAT family N-acetyltransferase [Candidatus Synoicihabitans palmerolidicus]|nr:GNAT family N-acetyltransferase [Candidatus Synoicihabitans palmerolidicus]
MPRWLAFHASEFGTTLNHVTLSWDEPIPGENAACIAAGFRLNNDMVLSMSSYAGGVTTNPNRIIRPLVSDDDWQAIAALQIDVDREYFAYPEDGGEFRRTQLLSARQMSQRGRGDWWGAYLQDQLVGGMGLYFDRERTLGRFQYVTILAAFRRQRVCSTLLDHIARHAFATVRPRQLVINTGADETNPAKAAYQKIGFSEATRSFAVTRMI